jgi:hypothetical protein
MKRANAATSLDEEQQRQAVERYYETINLMQDDAVRSANATELEEEEEMRKVTARTRERVTALKEKAVIISAEHVSKQELVDSMQMRLRAMERELKRLSTAAAAATAAAATGPVRQTDDQRVASLTELCRVTMDRAIQKKQESDRGVVPASLAYKTAGSGPTITTVFYTPNGEAREAALEKLEMRLGRTTTFREVRNNAARTFGDDPSMCVLEDEHGTVWPYDMAVSREIARYRGACGVRVRVRVRLRLRVSVVTDEGRHLLRRRRADDPTRAARGG